MLNQIRSRGFFSCLRLFFDIIYTKIFFNNLKIIKSPRYIKNNGKLIIGKNSIIGAYFVCETFFKNSEIRIGKNFKCFFNLHIGCMNKIEVGDDVLVASKVYISDHAHGFYKGNKQSNPKIPPSEREYDISSVYIGNRVWIGENVCILPGVSIGDGSIIGANSVVNNNIPTNSIAVGSPAKVIKFFNENDKKWKKSVQ